MFSARLMREARAGGAHPGEFPLNMSVSNTLTRIHKYITRNVLPRLTPYLT